MNLMLWVVSAVCAVPPYLGWGKYKLEGLFQTCAYEYVTDDWNSLSFLLFSFVVAYVAPLGVIIYFYVDIVKAVCARQAAMRKVEAKMTTEGEAEPVNDTETGHLPAGAPLSKRSPRSCNLVKRVKVCQRAPIV